MGIKKWGITSLSLVFLLTAAGCSTTKAEKTAEESVLKVGINSELSTADVSLAMDNTACKVMSQVGEGLFSFNAEGEAEPALAEKTVEPTNEGLTYTFTIREGATWSNGDPITAQDFEYSWKRTVTPETASPQAYYFEGIKNYQKITSGDMSADELGVTALDEQTLEVNLEYPMSYFQQLLAVPAFYPLNKDFVEKNGDNYGTSSETTLYNGPFVLEGWTGVNTSWSYVKNEKYWDKEQVKLDNVDVDVIKEVSTGKNMFDAGQLDEVLISGETAAQEKDNKNLVIRELPGTYYIQLNTKNDVLKNKNARKAIGLALDSEKLAENVLNDGSKKALGFVPTGFVHKETGKDFAEEVGDINPADSGEAKKLWEAAKKELGINEAKLTVLCSDSDSSKKISEFVQGSLTEALPGLIVDVSPVPFNNRMEMSRSGEFDIVLGGWTPVYADPIDFLNLLQSDNANNFGRFSNSEFDKLISDANNLYANDYEKRWETMMAADKLVAEEAPLIPLYQITEAYLVNSKVKGIEYGPLGSTYYKTVEVTN